MRRSGQCVSPLCCCRTFPGWGFLSFSRMSDKLHFAFLSLCLWLMAGCAAASAQPPVQALAWWMDGSGKADVEEVSRVSDWQPLAGWKSFGYGAEPVWVRLQLRAAEPEEKGNWIISVRPAFLDQLTLHDPVAGLTLQLGDFHTTADDALESLSYAFEVPALPQARTLYLRLESSSTRTLRVEVSSFKQAQRQARQLEWLLGAVLTLSLFFGVWGLYQGWYSRDSLMVVFAIKQFVSTLWAFFLLGFARLVLGDKLPAGVLSFVSSCLMFATVLAVFGFMGRLLKEYGIRPWMRQVMRGLSALIFLALLLHFLGMTWQALQMLNSIVPASLVWLLLTLALSRTSQPSTMVPRHWMLAYLVAFAAMSTVPSLIYLGIVDEPPLIVNTQLLHLLMDAVMIFVILQLRTHRISQQRSELESRLAVSAEQGRLDKLYLDEQRRLLLMLAHEIKTPLTSLRIWLHSGPQGQQVMERTIDDMSLLIERCVQTGQLADPSLQAKLQTTDAVDLTEQVVRKSRAPDRLRLALPQDVALVETDPQMLAIVLSNVVDNAYKYSPPGSVVTLGLMARADASGAAGWVWVIENAPGMAGFPEVGRLFEKYYRSPQAQRQSGSGLGLYLVKSLVQLLGGQVTHLAIPERIRFEVWLPAALGTGAGASGALADVGIC